MSYVPNAVRPGLTAIAAVLALSSTPSFAQDSAPATVTPPPVVAPAPLTIAAPATPAPVVAPAVQSTTPADAPASGSLVTVPTRPGGIASGLNAAPTALAAVPEPQVETESRPVARTAPTPRATPRTSAPTAPVTVERTAPAAPVTETAPVPVAPVPVAEAPVAVPAPVTSTRTTRTDASDDMLPIAGAAGAAILLIGGGVFAMRRRRRDDEEVYVADTVVAAPADPVPVAPQPVAYAATPVAMAAVPPMAAQPVVAANGPATAIPPGFDLSRFGRHTQAAYAGPTPDNPFLSLKSRLKRASFFDGRERMAEQGAQPMTQAARAPARPAAAAPRQTEHVTTRIKAPPRPGFRPAWQS
jgi:hypothetical protein